MEIHKAVADFSENLVLEYLKERSEAVGIPCNFTFCDDDDDKDTCSSDDDKATAVDGDPDRTRTVASTSRDEDHETFGVRVKDRAKSIDSGVCVDTKRENGRWKKEVQENRVVDGIHGNVIHVNSQLEDDVKGCDVVAGPSEGACQPQGEDDGRKSLVLTFKKGDLFAVSIWFCLLSWYRNAITSTNCPCKLLLSSCLRCEET